MKVKDNILDSLKNDFGFSEIINNDSNNFTNRSTIHRYRQLLEGNFKSIALNYLMNYKNFNLEDSKNISYFNKQKIAVKERYLSKYNELIDNKTIKIKNNFRTKLLRMLKNRQSIRKFYKTSLSKKTFDKSISVLLNTKRMQLFDDYYIPSRGYASGGGLYSIDVYLLILNVKDIPRGIYKLQVESETLRLIRKIDFEIDKLFLDNISNYKDSSYIIYYVYDFSKLYPKYGELSLYLALVEVGEMAQLIDLSMVDVGLCGFQSGSFNKKYIESIIGIDGITEHVIHSQLVGVK